MQSSSQPSSPVYPVRFTIIGIPSISASSNVNAGAAGRPSFEIAFGPWTASRPYSSETSRTSEPLTSRSFSQAKSASRFDAFTTSR